MTPDAQRIAIAIAKACGWTDCHFPLASNVSLPFTQRVVCGIAPGQQTHSPLPNYPGSLDAMHEAEKQFRTPRGAESDRMVEDRMVEYAERLNYSIDATAVQRAEAFLRTLNLWTTA